MADNKLAPKLTGVNRLIDFGMQRLNPQMFPTSARTLIETLQGNTSPITETQFSPQEIEALRQLVMLKGGDAGDIQYEDYGALNRELQKQGKASKAISVDYDNPGLFGMTSSLGNIQTTLGRFRYARDADGKMQIIDTYDFNPPQKGASPQRLSTAEFGPTSGPYGFIRSYAGEKIPPGSGRPVKINLD
jgi:hypothetical protein